MGSATANAVAEFLTPGEYMRLVKISRPTFDRHVAAGKIPGAVKVGGQWRIVSRLLYARLEAVAAHGEPATSKKRARRGNSKRVRKNGIPRKR